MAGFAANKVERRNTARGGMTMPGLTLHGEVQCSETHPDASNPTGVHFKPHLYPAQPLSGKGNRPA